VKTESSRGLKRNSQGEGRVRGPNYTNAERVLRKLGWEKLKNMRTYGEEKKMPAAMIMYDEVVGAFNSSGAVWPYPPRNGKSLLTQYQHLQKLYSHEKKA